MQSGDRDEFLKQLRVLFAGLDKHLGESREEAFWKGLAQMSLIEFCRCCDLVLEELQDGDKRREYTKSFTPGDVWAAKRKLRARASAPRTQDEQSEWTGDKWDIRANYLLLGYINDRGRLRISYCDAETMAGVRSSRDPSQETRELTEPLIVYKHAWARDMRELEAERGNADVSKAEQIRTFHACMRQADGEIDRVRQRYALERGDLAA